MKFTIDFTHAFQISNSQNIDCKYECVLEKLIRFLVTHHYPSKDRPSETWPSLCCFWQQWWELGKTHCIHTWDVETVLPTPDILCECRAVHLHSAQTTPSLSPQTNAEQFWQLACQIPVNIIFIFFLKFLTSQKVNKAFYITIDG